MKSNSRLNSWLYVLIFFTIFITIFLTSMVLDKLGHPVMIPKPPIWIPNPWLQKSKFTSKVTSSDKISSSLFSSSSNTSSSPAANNVRKLFHSLESRMSRSLGREKLLLEKEMKGYELKEGMEFKDLDMKEGGHPIRAMVSTTWRSGSTFLGDIMDSHPATYYHYEPLLHYDIRQARTGALAADAIRTLKQLMHCNYTNLESYLNYGKNHNWLFLHNTRLWKYCKEGGNPRLSYCWSPEFLNRFCPLFPFQSIKTVRLRLNLTRQLVEDKSLNVRVLLLVRDPRGTIQSRKHRTWCPGNPDCDEPARLCQDLVSDYHSAVKLVKEYPKRYKVVRYEDFSMDPFNNTIEVFDFFGFSFHPKVSKFLDTHTKTNIGGVSSTFRDSKTAPFKWREKLTIKEVDKVQDACGEAMKLWGYQKVFSEEKLKTFEPVINLGKWDMKQDNSILG